MLDLNYKDSDFYEESVSAQITKPPKLLRIALFSIGIIILLVIFIMNFFYREIVVRGKGTIRPSSEIRTIENLEGGIVSNIYINETDHVNRGEILLKLYNPQDESRLKETRAEVNALEAKRIRLTSLIDGVEPNFPEKLRESAPIAVVTEKSVYDAVIDQLASKTLVLDSRISQKEAELIEAKAEIQKQIDRMATAEENLRIFRQAVANKVRSEIDLIRAEKEVNEIASAIASLRDEIPLYNAAVEQAKFDKQDELKAETERYMDELIQTMMELDGLKATLKELEDILERTTIYSPVDGTVKQLFVTSRGNTLNAGQAILELVPDDDSTLVRVNVSPTDIGFIRECSVAYVEFTALDFNRFGYLDGWVERISPDALMNQEGQPFFEVDIRSYDTNMTNFKTGQNIDLDVGMEAEGNIRLGKRKFIHHIMKPIAKNYQDWSLGDSNYFNQECLKKLEEDRRKEEERQSPYSEVTQEALNLLESNKELTLDIDRDTQETDITEDTTTEGVGIDNIITDDITDTTLDNSNLNDDSTTEGLSEESIDETNVGSDGLEASEISEIIGTGAENMPVDENEPLNINNLPLPPEKISSSNTAADISESIDRVETQQAGIVEDTPESIDGVEAQQVGGFGYVEDENGNIISNVEDVTPNVVSIMKDIKLPPNNRANTDVNLGIQVINDILGN